MLNYPCVAYTYSVLASKHSWCMKIYLLQLSSFFTKTVFCKYKLLFIILQLESPVYAGKYYDSGVCLTDDGLPSKPEYIVRMSNATLSVHSLHLLLWANFGAFSISLLTRPGSTEQISGTLISKDLPIRHYCLDNVIKMWNCMHKALHLSAEELTFFIKRCMLRLIDVSAITNYTVIQTHNIIMTIYKLRGFTKF